MSRMITILLTSSLTLLLSTTSVLAQTSDDSIECDVPYVVAAGDTLVDIATRAYGQDRFDDLYELNLEAVGANPNLIFVGMQLDVPCVLDLDFVNRVQSADFSAAPQSDQSQTDDPASDQAGTILPDRDESQIPENGTQLVFNRASAPKFILNIGIVDEYLAQITEVTQGRVTFIDPPVIERDPRKQYDLVVSGAVDGAYVFNGHLAQSHPLLQLPMQALMGGTAEQTAVALWQLHEDYLSRTNYFDDVQLLGFIGAPAAHIWRLKENIVTPGENIASMNEYTVPYFDGLDTRGAAAVQEENAAWLAEFDDEQGQSMTMVMAHGAALAGGIWKDNNRIVTEIENGVYTPTFSVILNKDSWGRISTADQAAILAISGEELARRSAAWDAFDDGLRVKMQDSGLETVKADRALLSELQDQSRIGLESWISAADAKGFSGFEAVNDYIENLHSTDTEVQ